jgi:hypothetical protein
MNDFIQGFKRGAKETPLAYFAPAIALWRLFYGVTESLLRSPDDESARGHSVSDLIHRRESS